MHTVYLNFSPRNIINLGYQTLSIGLVALLYVCDNINYFWFLLNCGAFSFFYNFKGTVARDYRFLVFGINRTHLVPYPKIFSNSVSNSPRYSNTKFDCPLLL
jgi:hypothetical protein